MNWIYALIIYLPTCAYIPVYTYLLLIPLFFYQSIKSQTILSLFSHLKKDKNLLFLLCISGLALINRLYHLSFPLSLKALYSNYYILPLTYLASFLVSKKVLRNLLILLAFETLTAILEYLLGISTFLYELKNYRFFTSYELLYDTRVFGWGYNSSILAEKLFVGLIILYKILNDSWKRNLLQIIFIIGIIITFSRTVILLTAIFLVINNIVIWFNHNKSKYFQTLITISYFLFFLYSVENFKKQFTRNGTPITANRLNNKPTSILSNSVAHEVFPWIFDKEFIEEKELSVNAESDFLGKIELSGRREIWGHFIRFIEKHPILGNGSEKYMAKNYHAHNSILQSAASHGIIITILLIAFFGTNINIKNAFIILPIFALSMMQYVFLWGISFMDIIFYFFLFHFPYKSQ